MPLYPTSFFIPASPALPYLLEDKYIRGGYHCVVDIAERDAMSIGARKPGMRVYVADTGETFTLANGDLNNWVLVPDSASRDTFSFTPGAAILDGASADFTVATGKSAFVLKASITLVDFTLECHSTSTRNDSNPYTFKSYTGHLSDDGSSVLEDATTQYNRRFAIVSNLEATPGVNTYWRITNNSGLSATPTVDLTFLPLEA